MANLSGIGVPNMSEYRAYRIGDDGHVASFRAFVCDSDADATVWATQLFDGYDIELWSGDRLVTCLNSVSKPGTVSKEVLDGRMMRKNKSVFGWRPLVGMTNSLGSRQRSGLHGNSLLKSSL
jgi:hypothetical protein